jgi:hypothetical protein
MAISNLYRIKAAAFHDLSQTALTPHLQVEYEKLALAFLLLAEQADVEPPPPKLN